jgi:hypothetical protein
VQVKVRRFIQTSQCITSPPVPSSGSVSCTSSLMRVDFPVTRVTSDKGKRGETEHGRKEDTVMKECRVE